MPYATECPACGGRGCEHCDDGALLLTGCPRKTVSADVWDLLEYADLFRKGCPPEPGGVLDQASAFVTAARFAWSERDRVKADAFRGMDSPE